MNNSAIGQMIELKAANYRVNGGLDSETAYRIALEDTIEVLTETLANRDNTIKEMDIRIKTIICEEYHGNCECWNINARYQCVSGYTCGFPHTFSAPNNCPQCGNPGVRVDKG